MGVKVNDVNDENGHSEVAQTIDGRKIICIYNPANNLYFLNFADGGKRPPEFEGYFTDKARAEMEALAYVNRDAFKKGIKPVSQEFIPDVIAPEGKPKEAGPATNFKKEMKKAKLDPDFDKAGIVNLGSADDKPVYEKVSIKLP